MDTNIKSYFKLLRITDWRGHFLEVLLGFFVAKGFLFPLWDIIIFFAMSLLFFAFGFSINDCFDTKEDILNEGRKNPVAEKELSFKKALSFSITLGLLGLSLSFFFGFKIFLFSLVGILLGFFYSAPPIRLKSRPFLDLISHGLFVGVFLFGLPLLVFNVNLTLFHYLIAFSIFYVSVTLELRNHLEDYESDVRAGLRTSVCVFGPERSEKFLRYLMMIFPLSLFSIFLLINKIYMFLFLGFSLVFLFFLFSKKNSRIVKSHRIMDAYVIPSFVLVAISTL
jgi:4-hydroxybenzoate polyprenyltransferase